MKMKMIEITREKMDERFFFEEKMEYKRIDKHKIPDKKKKNE